MNKKGDVFLPVFAILMFIAVVFGFGIIVANENKVKREFDIGSNQIELIDMYYKAEGDLFNLDQKVRYSNFKTVEEFSDNGGINKTCDGRWKFNSECEPDFEIYFLEIFKEKMKEDGLDVNVMIEDEFLVGDVNEFSYKGENERMNYSYKVEGKFKEELKIDLEYLESLKDTIKDCIQEEKELDLCAGGTKEGNIISFSIDVGRIFYGSKFEDVVLKFEINNEDTGLKTSLI